MSVNINYTPAPIGQPETLEGAFGDFFRGTVRVITAPFKAAGHTAGEAFRGITTGDFKRVILAPVKGGTHFVMETYRGTADTAAIGVPILSIAGSIPSPASPFLLGGAAGLAVLGKIRQKQIAGDALNAQEAEFIKQQMDAGNVQMVDMETYQKVKDNVSAAEAQYARQNPAGKGIPTGLLAAGGAVAAALVFLATS